jgi:subtilisin family serine protease
MSGELYSQDSGIIQGNIIAMISSSKEVSKLVSELKFIDGKQTGFKVDKILSASMNIYLFDFDFNSIEENTMLATVRANPKVKIAQFNHKVSGRNIPGDPNFSSEWDMNNIGGGGGVAGVDIDALAAWDVTTGGITAQGDTIVVAVVDGGFDLAHEDLDFWKNRNEIAGNGIDDDGNGYIDDVKGWNAGTSNDNITVAAHGTHVCGTVGAKGNNGIGVSGVNWHVKIMPVMNGSGVEADVVIAYSYVMDNRRLYNQTNGAKGAFIVATNSSFGVDLGMPSAYPLWCAMYDSLGSVGILSACATANSNYNVDVQGDIPTACPSNYMISVTNTTRSDSKYTSCGYGSTTIDLGAPGTSITSTLPSNTYGVLTGTSMATPHVAGTIALMYSVMCSQFMINVKSNPAGIAMIVRDSLLGAVDVIPSMSGGVTVTGGRLNLNKSIKAMENYCSAVTVITPRDSTFEIRNIYPNPSQGSMNIVFNSYENDASIVITDVLGQEVLWISANCKGLHSVKVDLTGIAKGVYFVYVKSRDKKTNIVKLVVG